MAKELKNEELEQVTGGSHVSPSNMVDYVGKDMLFSYGILCWMKGPYTVHINSVHNDGNRVMVNMTFLDPAAYDAVKDKYKDYTHIWTFNGNNNCEFNYNQGDTWLE